MQKVIGRELARFSLPGSNRCFDPFRLHMCHWADAPGSRLRARELACRLPTAKLCRGGLLRVEGCRHFCAIPVPQGIWVWASSVESIIVRAVNPDHSEGLQYHVLPDDPLRALNILREAAGLPPLSDEPDK